MLCQLIAFFNSNMINYTLFVSYKKLTITKSPRSQTGGTRMSIGKDRLRS